MTQELIDKCIALIHREVVPATGCTEPVAVALAAAKASQVLASDTVKGTVWLSANMLKNAMGVGIPGTGMIGLPIAIALGIVIAEPRKELSILDDFSAEEFEKAKKIVADKRIDIKLKDGEEVDKLYIEIWLTDAENNQVKVIIQENHRNICYVSRNGEELLNTIGCSSELRNKDNVDDLTLNFDLVYQFAMEAPLPQIEFIYEAAELNRKAAVYSLQHSFGHAVGAVVSGNIGKKYLGDSVLADMLTYTGAACDARMDGAPIAVMSNSGSGNQGITSTLPVWAFAQRENKSYEQTVRALALSSLMVIYIKQKLGRLSALCGCVVASTGSSCGITYLMGGTKTQIAYAIKNMVGNITGMLCDGAKPSCSMKVSSSVSSALLSAMLAIENHSVTSNEGIVDEDVDKTIDNLTAIGRDSMTQTDRLVLNIMTHK